MEQPQQQEVVKEERKKSSFELSLEKRNTSREDFRIIKEVLYPHVTNENTLLMAIDYCNARKLDIMKRLIQIVPIWDSKKKCMVDTIWSSIAEIRTTATRTGQYAGKSEASFGDDITENICGVNVTYPKWCRIKVYRMLNGEKCEFISKLFWKETFKSTKDGGPNSTWATKPYFQLEKCTEAAALRSAFPEEVGSDYIAEEAFISGQEEPRNVTPSSSPEKPNSSNITDLLNEADDD